MTKKIIFFLLVFTISYMLLLDKNKNIDADTHEELVLNEENELLKKVLKKAISFKGTPFKFGGESKDGMDCSGVVFASYKEIGLTLPRSSRNMFYEGVEVNLKEVDKGDLLFFDVKTFNDKVNHVGMVTSVNDYEVNFIHSTDLKGVIITSINESDWKKAFIKAKRIIK